MLDKCQLTLYTECPPAPDPSHWCVTVTLPPHKDDTKHMSVYWTAQVERTDQSEFCNYDIIRFRVRVRVRVRVRLAKFNLVRSFYLILFHCTGMCE